MPSAARDRSIPYHQRVIAVGQIATGMIHDANNALSIVVWNLERCVRSLPATSNEAVATKMAIDSAMKAAALLQRILGYASHSTYDPGLVNLEDLIARLITAESAAIENDIRVNHQRHDGIGPVVVNDMLLELGLLEFIATLARRMAKNGSITLRTEDVPPGESSQFDNQDASILLSLTCVGLAADCVPPLQATLLQRFTELAGGKLTVATAGKSGCEIQLYLPRARASSGDGTVFT